MSALRTFANLNSAIATMRGACEEAERAMVRHADDHAYAAQKVLHAFAWGFANASSGIEAAMSAIEDGHAKTIFTLKNKDAT